MDSRQLDITPGVRAIERVDGRFRVHGADHGERTAAIDINAVNPAPQAVPGGARQLVSSLVSTGLATLHPSGGVVAANPRLHVVGDLTGGGSFITASIPGVAAQAFRTAQALRAA